MLKGYRVIEKSRRRLENIVDMNLQQIEYASVNWIHVAQGADMWWPLVLNILVPYRRVMSSVARQLLPSQEGLCSVELIR